MRAIRCDGGTIRLDEQAADPTPAPGEALVRPVRLGVSDADIAAAAGEDGFTGVLGHEFVGVVERVNVPSDAAPALRARADLVGRRMTGSANVICGTCDMCRAGLSAHCRNRKVIGVAGRDGCFADLFTIPVLNLHDVPEGVDDERAVMAPLLARALHTARLVRVESRSYVSVLGDGALALLTAQALARLNASVRLLGDRAERIGLCERWGVKHRLIDDVGRRQDQEVVVDCTGSSAGLRLAMQLVRPRGAIVLTSPRTLPPFAPGVPLGESPSPGWSHPIDLSPLIANEVQILGSRDGPLPDAVALLESGEVEVVSLITRRCRLNDGVEAIRAAGGADQIKVLIEP